MNVYMILTNGFDPDIRVYKEAKYLVEHGFCVEILCWDRKCEYKDNSEEVIDGIKIKRFEIHSIPGSGLKQGFSFLKFCFTIRKYLKNKNYNYLHCHDFDGFLSARFVKYKKNKKIIFDMHEIYNNYSYARFPFFTKIFNYFIKKSDYVIYVNDSQLIKTPKSQYKKFIYIPNYPIKNQYEPIAKNKNDKIRINYIGKIRDYDSLVKIININLDKSKYVISLYGSGTCYNKLLNEFSDSSVNFMGAYNGIKESADIYRNTDILFCLYNPSNKNWKMAYPVKLYEAIITLTPILVSKNTVAGDFVEKNKIGIAVEYENEEELKNAINKISENYDYYTKKISKINERYSWEKICKNLDIIYNKG